MKLYFRQRLFSWLDSYDIYDAEGAVVYKVKGVPAIGHCLVIEDNNGQEAGRVRERVLHLLPSFDLYKDGRKAGSLQKELTFLKPRYRIDYRDWTVEGSFTEWDYAIKRSDGTVAARISKELWHLTDTYVIDVADGKDTLDALMSVLAIDAEKCSRND